MRVALFVTCLVDLHRPTVGFAAIKLLEDAGCTVEVPAAQTCCGQPAYNSGDRLTAQRIGLQVIDAFEGYEYIVVPSGSCAGMIRHHLPHLFDNDPALKVRADRAVRQDEQSKKAQLTSHDHSPRCSTRFVFCWCRSTKRSMVK